MKPLQPLSVADVGLATGDMLGIARVDQKDLKAALVQQFEDRDPINSGDSMTTVFTPQSANQSAKRQRSAVNVPKLRTGSAEWSAPTAATCIVAPMSIAAASAWTIVKSEGRTPEGLSRFISPLLIFEAKGWAAQSINFLIGIVRKRHHSQARDSPWTMFFNGVKRHQKANGRSLPCAIWRQPFLRPQADPIRDSFLGRHAPCACGRAHASSA